MKHVGDIGLRTVVVLVEREEVVEGLRLLDLSLVLQTGIASQDLSPDVFFHQFNAK